MTRIDIEEVRRRILNIADAFDKICAEHDIPYIVCVSFSHLIYFINIQYK